MKIEEVYGSYAFVDVRSPKEFDEDHVPGAVNVPIFSNEERAIVGTIYKQESKEKAIDKGLEIFSKKMPGMVKRFESLRGKKVCVYCWRGGMRSGSVVGLLKGLGFDVVQLDGGYKSYRKFAREQLESVKIPPLVVLYGLTGSGKTEMLEEMENSVDLEGLAEHRGSIFGDINLKPNSQKRFDSLLLKRLLELKDEKIIFTEGESRRIGRILISEKFWEAMKKGQKVKVVSPIDERVDRIYRIYCDKFDKELFKDKTRYIKKHIGGKKTEELCMLIDQGEVKEFLRQILLEYYDKLYAHTVDNKNYVCEVKSKEELEKAFFPALSAL